jgi:hypothetical protein
MSRVGTAVIELSMQDKGVARSVAAIEKTMRTLQSRAESMSRGIGLVLGGAGVVAGFQSMLKAAGEAEEAQFKLNHAIEASGASLDQWSGELNDAANALEELTGISDEALRNAMAYAVNMGVAASSTEDFTKAAIGLAKITGDDLQTSMKQLMLAQQGEFTMLQRSIPGLRNATSDTQRLAMVNDMARKGYDAQQASLGTYAGQMRLFKENVGDAAEELGAVFLPAATAGIRIVRNLVLEATDWTAKNHELVLSITQMTAGTLAAAIVVPRLVAAVASAASMVQTLGSTLITLATGPIGLVIGALGGLAAAVILASGKGDTFAERWATGMGVVGDTIDVMLGSFEGFTAGAAVMWTTLIDTMTQTMIGFGSWFGDKIDDWTAQFKNLTIDVGNKASDFALGSNDILNHSMPTEGIAGALLAPLRWSSDAIAQEYGSPTSSYYDPHLEQNDAEDKAQNVQDAEDKKAERGKKSQATMDAAIAEAQAHMEAAAKRLQNLPKATDRIKAIMDAFKDAVGSKADPNAARNQFNDLLSTGVSFGAGESKTIKAPKIESPQFEGLEDTWKRIQQATSKGGSDPQQQTADNTHTIAGEATATRKASEDSATMISKAVDLLTSIRDRSGAATYGN